MLEKTYSMDLKQQTAASYYNKHRKRSFLLSRIIVGVSMVVLVVALAINIAALSTQDNSTTQSHASSPQDIKKYLPSLPAGCKYKQTTHGMTVTCPTAVPTQIVNIPIKIALPQLPPQCQFATSPNGDEIQCSPSASPIPTVPVQIPTNCTPSDRANTLVCTDTNNSTFNFPLPSLPKGCAYQKLETNYFVVCQAK
jgi:hypothetical protein